LRKTLSFVVAGLLGLALIPATAEATISSVTVTAQRPYEGANNYTYAELTVNGTVARADGTVGVYSVPATIIYPSSSRNTDCDNDDGRSFPGGCGRLGIVDWINGAYYQRYPNNTEDGLLQFTLLATGSYIFDHGYTYLTINWNLGVLRLFGTAPPADGQYHNHLNYGSMERAEDEFEVMRDAARLLKSSYHGGPAAVNKVIGQSYSQSAGLQIALLAYNQDPTHLYDAHLIAMSGFRCWNANDVAPSYGGYTACTAPLPTSGHTPVITLVSESDMSAFDGFHLRNNTNPNWRQYEMAGIAHLGKGVLDFTKVPFLPFTDPAQSISDAKPIFRAALRNLTLWVCRGITPPAATYLDGGPDPANPLNFVPVPDADGNWLGGMRLPHVSSTVNNKPAGAPLGVYVGLNLAGFPPNPLNVFMWLGGTFTRFSDADLLSRYPTRKGYVELVSRAATANVVQRYINIADANALIQRARVEPLAPGTRNLSSEGPDEDDQNEFPLVDGGCSAAYGASSGSLLAIAIMMLVRRRRRRA
jgi:hypothetical protein